MRKADIAPLTSVVVPARNAADLLGQQLDALAQQDMDRPWEVIVVDNGSTDDTVQVALSRASQLPGLRVVPATVPGVSAARNAGIAAAAGRYVLFCDADDVVTASWVRLMSEALDVAPLVGGEVDEVSLNNGPSVGWAPAHPAVLPVVASFLPRAIGANLGVHRDLAQALGGFDESYVGASDDTEFCWRLQLAGHRLMYVPGAVVLYRRRTSLRAFMRKEYTTGKARVKLYAQFRASGMPRTNPVRAFVRWPILLLALLVTVTDPARRGAAVCAVAASAGRVVGSVQNRVLYL